MQQRIVRESGFTGRREGQNGRVRRWLVEYPRAVPVAIFLALAAVTGVAVVAIESGEAQRERAHLQETAQSVASALDRRGNTFSAYLKAGAVLFSSLDRVDPELFARFARELRIDTDFKGAEGVGWAEATAPHSSDAFARRIAGVTGGDFHISPAPSAAAGRIVPVTYILPLNERNRRALGYDMYSEPVRRAAMEEAERTGRPAASGRIVLVQEGQGDAPGFLIYMPVFEPGRGAQRLKGFIYSPFNALMFLDNAVDPALIKDVGVRLYDGKPGSATLLAEHGGAIATGRTLARQVRIANRPFWIEIESAREDALSPLAMATLLFGLAVASLMLLLVRVLTRQAGEDEAMLAFLEQQNSIRDSLARELNHRVKNTLANVLSIVALTRRRTKDMDEFADGLNGRIRALSATHDLLIRSEWGTTALGEVIETELAPYVSLRDEVVEIAGPEIDLAPNDALSLGMAVHELATNAAKFGALTRPGGRISVTWRREGEALAVVEWRESGGPPVPATRKPGFGTELIEKIVAHELRHPVDLEMGPDGVRCTLRVPVRARNEFRMREGRADPGA